MKIAVTSSENQLNSKFDTRFGRSAWFCVLDSDTTEIKFIENKNKNINGGAGIKAAEKMAELGIQKVVSGDFGPKAKPLLEKFGIQMIIQDEKNQSVQSIVNRIEDNQKVTAT